MRLLLNERQERSRTLKGLIVDMSVEQAIVEVLDTISRMLRPARSDQSLRQ
jgi:hypothetical protein